MRNLHCYVIVTNMAFATIALVVANGIKNNSTLDKVILLIKFNN